MGGPGGRQRKGSFGGQAGAAGRAAGHTGQGCRAHAPKTREGNRSRGLLSCLLPLGGARVGRPAGQGLLSSGFQLETPGTPPLAGRWPLESWEHTPLGGVSSSRKPPWLASPRLCQPARARMCGFPPRAHSNPPTLQQIIKTHLYLICLLELIEFLRSANATVCAASRSLARNS